MITRFRTIKGLGLVFSDFRWGADVLDFKTVNLVYGWNGSGKTTLTRLFDEIAQSSDAKIEYEAQTSDGSLYKPGDVFPRPIRVFNHDYISRNVQVLESRANTISITLGAENKELVTQIETDERELNGDPSDPKKPGKVREFEGYTQKRKRKEKENEIAFSNIAMTIGAAIGGTALRTYRRPNAAADFPRLSKPALLSSEELEANALVLKQEELALIDEAQLPESETGEAVDAFLTNCQSAAETATKRTVAAKFIERLSHYPEIATWVERGIHIHSKYSSGECEYCGNAIRGDRVAALANHFSESDRQLKEEIDGVLTNLDFARDRLAQLKMPDRARLYKELQKTYGEALDRLDRERSVLQKVIEAVEVALREKRAQTSQSMSLSAKIDPSSFADALRRANEVIAMHNSKCADFRNVRFRAEAAIKAHYLSTIYDDVKKRQDDIAGLDSDLLARAADIEAIRERIASARQKISSDHAACGEINKVLSTFLGRSELRFEPAAAEGQGESDATDKMITGYKIMRGKEPAVYLSEGEKTAIAFVYFVVHLRDGHFARDRGIVVIDDPISSLDSSSVYQAFSFLKNAVQDCYQVFIFTHNFDFLKLLLNWRSQGRERSTGFFTIKNVYAGDLRMAQIVEMEDVLRRYHSEYQYLFKLLKEMYADQDGTIMRAYPVPNIARKVWETFLMFRIPNGDSQYKKMEQLKKEGIPPPRAALSGAARC